MVQLWPPPTVDPATLQRQVWDVDTARTIPGVGRALQVYGGLISQCSLDQYRGAELQQPRPILLDMPDVQLGSRSTYVRVHVEDYLLHGNATHVVTARHADGSVANTRWFPAHMWNITDPSTTSDGGVDYYLNGRLVPRGEVVHVQRGADEVQQYRGVGIVEDHLKTLNRAGLEEAQEAENLKKGSVPSVAVIAPNPDLSQGEIDAAKDKWMEKFSGPGREPAFLPDGTKVIPLAWSPHDAELVEARKLTLIDLANCFNLDPYWLGGQSSSYTYKSPGPMFLALLRISLEPVMTDLEQVWSLQWFPPLTRRVRFDRLQLTRDDFSTEVTTGAAAVQAGLMTPEEWRVRWGLPPEPELGELKSRPQAPAAPVDLPDDAPDEDDAGDEDEGATE